MIYATLWAISFALAFSSLLIRARDLEPITPPPQCLRISSNRSLKLVFTASVSLFMAARSSLFVAHRARQAAVLRRTTRPRRALFFTMQYGTPIFLQRAGRKRTISKGSTSWAMMTREAFFCSTRVVTVFTPERTQLGRLVGVSSLPLARCSARIFKRVFFSCFDSGLYLSRRRNSWVAVCLSRVWLNWLIGGGTFKRWKRIAFWRWSLMYLGHATKRLRSRLGWMS